MQSVTHNRPMSPGQEPAEPDPQSCIISPLSVRIPVAVKMTGIGRSKLYKLIQEGAIDIVKIGSATLVPVASLERLLERHRRK